MFVPCSHEPARNIVLTVLLRCVFQSAETQHAITESQCTQPARTTRRTQHRSHTTPAHTFELLYFEKHKAVPQYNGSGWIYNVTSGPGLAQTTMETKYLRATHHSTRTATHAHVRQLFCEKVEFFTTCLRSAQTVHTDPRVHRDPTLHVRTPFKLLSDKCTSSFKNSRECLKYVVVRSNSKQQSRIGYCAAHIRLQPRSSRKCASCGQGRAYSKPPNHPECVQLVTLTPLRSVQRMPACATPPKTHNDSCNTSGTLLFHDMLADVVLRL